MRSRFALAVAAACSLGLVDDAAAGAGIPGLRILESDPTGVTVEYRLPEYELVPVETAEGTYFRVRVPGIGSYALEGKPETPVVGTWIAVPPTGSYTLRVLEAETEVRAGVEVVPTMRSIFVDDGTAFPKPALEYFRDEAAYASSIAYPPQQAAIESESWMRFQRVVNLRLHPVRVRAAENALLVTNRLVVRIDFEQSRALAPDALRRAGLEGAPRSDRHYEGVYRGAVLNYEQGRSLRARAMRRSALDVLRSEPTPIRRDATGFGNPEWKVRVDTSGVWAVDFAQLSVKGFPAGIDVDAVTVFYRDTTVGLQPEPWTVVEVPVDLDDGNGNGTFDGGDFLVLPVPNWNDRESPGWYERRYGDAEIYWVSFKSAGTGMRARREPGWLNATNVTEPTSFPSYRRYERDFFYLQYPQEVTQSDQFAWVNGFDDEPGPIDTLFADLLDLEPSGPDIRVSAQWLGNTGARHTVSGTWVNSNETATPLFPDSSFTSKQTLEVTNTMPAGGATEGINRFEISGFDNSALFGSGAPFNWFEVTYPRRFVARNNALRFNNGSAVDTVEFTVGGFVSVGQPNVYAYDLTDWTDPLRLDVAPAQITDQGGTWRIQLQRVAAGADSLRLALMTDVPRLPDAAITAEVASSLYQTPAGGADFIIVAYDAFADECEPLADFRRNQGISTLVAPAQDVYDEFNGGRKSHFAIRRFLRYAFENWDTRFALFVGDASEDAQGVLGTSDPDFLPTPIIQGFVPVTTGKEAVATDNWYMFRLNAVPNPTNDDLLVDMIPGRWSVSTEAEVRELVQKSIAYETPPLDEPWRNRAVMVADDEFSDVSTFGQGSGSFEYCLRSSERRFKQINQRLESVIKEEAGFQDYEFVPFYLDEKLSSIPIMPGSSCAQVRDKFAVLDFVDLTVAPELFVTMTEGAAFMNYQGHANAFQMAHEEIWVAFGGAQDIDLVFNDGKPWVFSGFACHLNSFSTVREGGQFGDAIGERMVNVASKGAIASFASTAFELLPSDPNNHLNLHFHRAYFVDPPFDEFAGQRGARVRVGEAAALGVARMVANVFNLFERKAAETYVLLGDPLSAMSFGAPRVFASAADNDSIPSGVPYFPTTVGNDVVIDFDVLDESFLETLTVMQTGEGASGAVPDSELTFTPEFPDTNSGKRYAITYDATPRPATYDIVVSAADRTGLTGQFILRFVLDARLSVDGQRLQDGDPALGGKEYVWSVRSPARLEASDLQVIVNGDPVSAAIAPARGDTTGRNWLATFRPDILDGANQIQIDVGLAKGGVSRQINLNVVEGLQFENVYAFPNPFRDFTTFNFNVTAGRPTDVQLQVFTVAGRLVYERTEMALVPGYYQWMWEGADMSGKVVSHGAYLYRLSAITDEGTKTNVDGRVVRAPIARPEPEEDPLLGGN